MAIIQQSPTPVLLMRAAKQLYIYAMTLPISEERDQALVDSTELETVVREGLEMLRREGAALEAALAAQENPNG